MRIAAICMRYPPEGVAGVATTVAALAEVAVEHGHDVFVASRTPRDRLVVEARDGVRVLRVPLTWSIVDAGAALRAELESFRPDVIDCHLNNSYPARAIVASADAAEAPIVQYLHHYLLMCRDGNQRRDGLACVDLCRECEPINTASRRFTDRVSAVVGVSQHIIDRHRSRGHFESVPALVAPPIIDSVVTSAVTSADASAADRDAEPTFGFIGRLAPEKGIAALLAEAARLDLRLAVAGDGPDQFVRTLRAAFESERIRFVGWQEPASFFPTIDVCVVPSLFEEPFGRVAIEAQAHGVPVIVSRVGGLAENVVEGETGWSYDPAEPGALAAVLSAAVGAPLPASTRCRSFARRFQPDAVWPSVEAFLAQVIAAEHRRAR